MATNPVLLEVRLLGPLSVEAAGRPLAPGPSRRAWELLGFLALRPGPLARSEVASALWPDVTDESARASLRSAVWALRRVLGGAADDRIETTRDAVGLVDDDRFCTDLRCFQDALEEDRLEDAVQLCRGPLLQGIDADWALVERDTVREQVSEALGALTAAALRRGDTRTAVSWARRRATRAPLDEAATRELMSALVAHGDRAAALDAFRRLADRLRRELHVAPAPATRELASRLRAAPAGAGGIAEPSRALLGRGRELARLDDLRRALRLGRPCAVVLGGEPGIGKTALAEELLRRLQAEGCRAAGCKGPAIGRPAPYAQWSELARQLEEPARAGSAELAGAASAPPDVQRALVRESAVAVLDRLTAEAPVALLFDDAYAADTASLELAGYAARRLRDRPLALVLTRRHFPRRAELDVLIHALRSTAREALMLDLSPLDARSSADLVRSRSQLSEAAVQRAVMLADGNPLLALESARALERGEPASAGLRAMVRAAIGRLPVQARDIAELVAVAGRPLDPTTLIELDATDAAETALDCGLLTSHRGDLRFRHELLREVAYEEIAGPRRVRLHATASRVAADPADRAHHLRRAGRHYHAAQALADAADGALALGEVAEAVALIADALRIDARNPELHFRLAQAQAWQGDGGAAETALGDALALSDPRDNARLGRMWLAAASWYRSSLCDPRRTREAAEHALRHVVGDRARRSEALAARAWACAVLGSRGEAERDLALAAELDREGRLAFDLALVRAHVLVTRGDAQASLRAFQDAAAAVRPAGRPDLAYGVWTHAAAVAAFAGDLDRALWYAERCLEDAGRIPHLRVPALAARGYVLSRLGRHGEAREDAARQLELATALQDPALLAVAEHDTGMIALAGGDYVAAEQHLSAALESQARVSRPIALLARAEARARLGRPAAADADVREVTLTPLRATDVPETLIPRLTGIQGLTAAARGDARLARRRLEEAADGWRRLISVTADSPLDGWVANIVDLGRPPAAGLVEPVRELARVLADLDALASGAPA